MKVVILKAAYKDLDNIPKVAMSAIEVAVLTFYDAKSIADLKNIKKLKGHKTAFRKRVGDYRIGFLYENETITIARILARKNIYNLFP